MASAIEVNFDPKIAKRIKGEILTRIKQGAKMADIARKYENRLFVFLENDKFFIREGVCCA